MTPDLYEASFEIEWLQWAHELQEIQNKLFWDDNNGGYFAVEEGDKNLVLRYFPLSKYRNNS